MCIHCFYVSMQVCIAYEDGDVPPKSLTAATLVVKKGTVSAPTTTTASDVDDEDDCVGVCGSQSYQFFSNFLFGIPFSLTVELTKLFICVPFLSSLPYLR